MAQTFDSYKNNPDQTRVAEYDKYKGYIAIPGTEVHILLEFPELTKDGKSLVLALDDVMTISFSVYRTKSRVIPLGSDKITGYGLGTRLVAGSMIRSIFTQDKLSVLRQSLYYANQDEIEKRLKGINDQLPSGLPQKNLKQIMLDDLGHFNIHMVHISEALVQGSEPEMRHEIIYGAVIINTGQVYSIEDLITEGTFAFEAQGLDVVVDRKIRPSNWSSGGAIRTGSSFLE